MNNPQKLLLLLTDLIRFNKEPATPIKDYAPLNMLDDLDLPSAR